MYAKMTNEDTTPKVKAYTEVSTTEAKDDVQVEGAAIQAVKERGAHTAALRQLQLLPCKLIPDEAPRKQMPSVMEAKTKLHNDKQCSKDDHKEIGLCPFEHVIGRPLSKENLTSDSLAQTDERLSLVEHNAKNPFSSLESKRDSLQDLMVTDEAVKVQRKDEWTDVSQWDLKHLPRDEG